MTNKQQIFIQEYLIDFNATQAAIRAGYSAKTATVIGCENLTKPKIKAEIDKYKASLAVKAGFSVQDAHRMYNEAYQQAKINRQNGAMVGATTGIARLYGMDKDAGGEERTVIIISPKSKPDKALPKQVDSEVIDNEV